MIDKIKLLEQWRDWHWQMSLKANDTRQEGYGNRLREYCEVITIAIRMVKDEIRPLPPIEGYENYKYGEWPKNQEVVE